MEARKLYRSRDQRVIAGVCGGIAEHFGIDPVLIRIALVGLAFVGGSGVLAYLVAWIAIPEAPERDSGSPGGPSPSGPGGGAPAVLLAIGAIALLPALWWGAWGWHDGPDLFPAIVLLGIGVWLLVRHSDEEQDPVRYDAPAWSAPGPVTATMPAGDEPTVADETSAPTTFAEVPPWTAEFDPVPVVRPWEAESDEPLPPRGGSIVGRLVFGALLIGGGVVWMLHLTDTTELSPGTGLAIALLIVGTGVLASAWLGRSIGLIVLGALLAFALAGVAAVDVPLRGGFGERTWTPQSGDELERQSPYELTAGKAVLDLTELERGDHEVAASVAFGELTVIVPRGVSLELDAEVQGGKIDNELGSDDEGWDLHTETSHGPSGAERTIVAEIDIAFGELTVQRD
jgi:phage shock protein PspC (stress-responsive transcriptional regulator)